MSKSTDYHDYVFRDGKLIGEFEEMYRNSAITPWHQDEQEDWIDVRLTKELIEDLGKFDEIHDLGCGTGHYLNIMANYCLRNNGRSYGYDISETACERAKKEFTSSTFRVTDLTVEISKYDLGRESEVRHCSRLFIIRGTLWYVIPKLQTVIENLKNLISVGDRLLIVQNFPPLKDEFVGKDVLPNHHALIDKFSSCFKAQKFVWYEDMTKRVNDNWFIGIFTRAEEI